MSRILRLFSAPTKSKSSSSSPVTDGSSVHKKQDDWGFTSSSKASRRDSLLPTYSPTQADSKFSFDGKPAEAADLPSYAKYELDDKQLKKILTKYDTIFVVDDSTSMTSIMPSGRTRWEEACEALADFAALASQYDSDGIDIHFFNSPASITGLQGRTAVSSFFGGMVPKGGTFIGKRIQELSRDYLVRLSVCANSSFAPWPKPRNYIIITDGKSRDEELLRNFINETAKALKAMKCPKGQLGFQFVQIGNNAGATKFLEELDGDTKHHSMDIVDTVKAEANESFCSNFPKKVLMGGINRHFDREVSIPSPSSPSYSKKY